VTVAHIEGSGGAGLTGRRGGATSATDMQWAELEEAVLRTGTRMEGAVLPAVWRKKTIDGTDCALGQPFSLVMSMAWLMLFRT
jgi:hypothetical protein